MEKHLQEPSTYKISVVFYPSPEKHKRRNIGSWPISPDGSELDLLSNDEFIQAILDRMKDKDIAIDDIHCIGIKKRQKDPYIYFPTDILLQRLREMAQSVD